MEANEHILALQSGNYGPEPDCAIGYLIPDGRKAYIVPKEYRALLMHIVKAREKLNYYSENDPYFLHSDLVEKARRGLDEAMLQDSGAAGVIEYHADWLYSVLSEEDILREHREFEEKNRPKNAGPSLDSGLCYSYLNQPTETCALRESILKEFGLK